MSLTQLSPLDWSLPAWIRERPFSWPTVWDEIGYVANIRVEEYEEDGTFVIRAEAPGIDPDTDVDLTLERSVLRLDIRRQQEKHDTKRKHRRSEFTYGSFTRMITLPRNATDKDVSAQYEDGILEVRVPLNGKDADTRHVPIKHK